jgi:hypothetical protein
METKTPDIEYNLFPPDKHINTNKLVATTAYPMKSTDDPSELIKKRKAEYPLSIIFLVKSE